MKNVGTGGETSGRPQSERRRVVLKQHVRTGFLWRTEQLQHEVGNHRLYRKNRYTCKNEKNCWRVEWITWSKPICMTLCVICFTCVAAVGLCSSAWWLRGVVGDGAGTSGPGDWFGLRWCSAPLWFIYWCLSRWIWTLGIFLRLHKKAILQMWPRFVTNICKLPTYCTLCTKSMKYLKSSSKTR